jgi:hypothetical protein
MQKTIICITKHVKETLRPALLKLKTEHLTLPPQAAYDSTTLDPRLRLHLRGEFHRATYPTEPSAVVAAARCRGQFAVCMLVLTKFVLPRMQEAIIGAVHRASERGR